MKFSPVLQAVMHMRLCNCVPTLNSFHIKIDFRLGKNDETALSLIRPRFNTAKKKNYKQ